MTDQERQQQRDASIRRLQAAYHALSPADRAIFDSRVKSGRARQIADRLRAAALEESDVSNER